MSLVRLAMTSDLPFIEDLRRKESEALGFVPFDVLRSITDRVVIHPGRHRWRYQVLFVAEDNQDLTGFCYASLAGHSAHIFQLAVRQDARRFHRALQLCDAVEIEARQTGKAAVSCRVAADLEACEFWRVAGYDIVGVLKGGLSRGRTLFQFRRELPGLFGVRAEAVGALEKA